MLPSGLRPIPPQAGSSEQQERLVSREELKPVCSGCVLTMIYFADGRGSYALCLRSAVNDVRHIT